MLRLIFDTHNFFYCSELVFPSLFSLSICLSVSLHFCDGLFLPLSYVCGFEDLSIVIFTFSGRVSLILGQNIKESFKNHIRLKSLILLRIMRLNKIYVILIKKKRCINENNIFTLEPRSSDLIIPNSPF